MRTEILEYIELADEEKAELWEKATFVFDTNVYLNLYRYSQKTRDALITAMQKLSDRIWMPNHVAHEFMKRRLDIIYESANQYKFLHDESQKIFGICTNALRFKDDDLEYKELQSLMEQVQKWLEEIKKKNLLVEDGTSDLILNKLLDIYEGKVGIAFDDGELEKIRSEGAKRYAKKVPPGYKDAPKAGGGEDNNAYGDLIIWKEILKYATADPKDIIYVTHDQKEDWWNKVHGETVGPRIELRKEFTGSTGHKFHMYNMTSFIQRVKNRGGKEIDQSVINEVNNVYLDLNNKIITKLCKNSDDQISQYVGLQDRINYLEAKNRKREKNISLQTKKYLGKDMPNSIKEQAINNQKNILITQAEIFNLKQMARESVELNLE